MVAREELDQRVDGDDRGTATSLATASFLGGVDEIIERRELEHGVLAHDDRGGGDLVDQRAGLRHGAQPLLVRARLARQRAIDSQLRVHLLGPFEQLQHLVGRERVVALGCTRVDCRRLLLVLVALALGLGAVGGAVGLLDRKLRLLRLHLWHLGLVD